MSFSTNGHSDVRDATLPPHSSQAEEAVLGSILKSPPAIRQVVDILEARDFYSPRHQVIWAAMQALEADNVPPDYHMLADKLSTLGTYDQAGGLLYLSEINLTTPSSAHIVHYAKIVARDSTLRRIISMAQGLASAAWRDDKEPVELLAELERRIAKLNSRALDGDGVDMAASMDNVTAALVEEREAYLAWDHERDGEYVAGWKTGFRDLDDALLGMKAGDLIYLAARTSVGKSILVQQIAMNVANRQGPVYFVSLEMSVPKLLHRVLMMRTGVPRHDLVRGKVSDRDYQAVQKTAQEIRQLPVRWDTTARTVEQVRRRVQRWADQMGKPVALVVVDYVQLLRDQASQRSNRYENVSLASHNLKDLAEALGTTVLAPAQVARAVTTRKSKMPDLSDLRESGDLEQDADIVLGLDREDYWDRESADHTARLAILKARDLAAGRGRGTIIHLAWLPQFERYGDLARDNVVPLRREILPDDLPHEPRGAVAHEQEDLPF